MEVKHRFQRRAVVLSLGNLDVFGLQLPEIAASTGGAEGFWELQSRNTWVTQGWEPTTLEDSENVLAEQSILNYIPPEFPA